MSQQINELDELIERRSKKVKLMQVDGDNSHETLAKLYGDSTHFITELLQNAEDEGASNVEFKLTENELIFSHDAKKLFDFNDIRAVSNFGDNQEKKEKQNAIGRFGIGFKSVYSITDRPRIISADYDITIIDYNIPSKTIDSNQTFFNGTKIILPFKESLKNKTQELLTQELQDLNLHYLLFLSNIRSIKWETQTNNGIYERVSQKKDGRYTSLKSSTKEIKFFLLEKNVEIDKKKLSLKIAFQLNNTNNKIVTPCDSSPLFVFFPTKIETSLKFLVHAPFYTTPARENIQANSNLVNIEQDHRNEELKKELGKLLAESLSVFKSMNMLNVDMLNVLPTDESNCSRSIIYKDLYESVKKELNSNKKLIPNTNGNHSSAKESLLLGSADLASLLNSKQTAKLFERNFWIDKRITENKTNELWRYLKNELEIPEYDLAGFASKISAEFMIEQSDNWIIQFYKVVHKANALWRVGPKAATSGILRTKPIIRIEIKGEIKQVSPFQSNGKPNAFLPAKEISKYATVKLNIAKNKEAKKFLEDIGLTIPDLFAEINEFIIPKFRAGQTYPGYFEDFKKILDTQSSNQEKWNRLLKDLRECPFIMGLNYETGETKLLKYNEVYFSSTNLKKYFAGDLTAYFVAEEQYSLLPKEFIRLKELLTQVGVVDYPLRKHFTAKLTWQEKQKLSNGGYTNENYCYDYELDGLVNFLSQEITLDKSIAMWQLLNKCLSVQQYSAQNFFHGEFSYKYYSEYIRRFESTFLKLLRQSKWIVFDNSTVLPNEISYTNLPELYKADNSNSKLLAEILGFKADEIKAIEDRTGGKFIDKDKYEKFKKWEAEQEAKKTVVDPIVSEAFVPEFKPEEAVLNTRKLEDTDINIEFQSRQGEAQPNDDKSIDDKRPIHTNTEETTKDKPSQKILNDIGDWGQSYVGIELNKEFAGDATIEVIDLNNNGEKGVGCDFIVKQNGEIIRLIEVKTTVEKFGQTLSISGTQWEVARSYFKVNDGDKYWVYCVFNAGQKNPEIVKIQNPIKKWKDGKLLAHPINFLIK